MLIGESSTHVGQYQIRERIGGSRAQLYKVWDPAENRTFALKLLTHQAADADALARFLLEAQILEKIVHQNIVMVFGAGEDFQGQPYLVMEYLQGQTLKDGIRRSSLGPLRDRILVALQLARALEHLHFIDIVHRRLQPEHIHVDQRGKLRLLSIGIARLDDDRFYHAPEAAGGETTKADDIYSYGVILYEMLGGTRGEQPGRAPMPAVPRSLQELIRRCTSLQREARPESFSAIARELEWWLAEPEMTPRSDFWSRPVSIPQRRLPLIAAIGCVGMVISSYCAYQGGYILGAQSQRAASATVQPHR